MMYVALPWLSVKGEARRAGEFLSGRAKVDQQRLVIINVLSCVFVRVLGDLWKQGQRNKFITSHSATFKLQK